MAINGDGVSEVPSANTEPPVPAETTATAEPAANQAVPEVSSGPSEEEIAAAEKELAELERIRDEYNQLKSRTGQAQPAFDSNALGQALAQALQPIIPKPPEPVRPWEVDDVLTDRKSLFGGIEAFYKHQQQQWIKEHFEPLQKELQTIKGILPQLYLRSAENPQYQQVTSRAQELSTKYGIEYWKAAQLAQDELAQQVKSAVVKPQVAGVPKHLSSPDTRQSTIPDLPDTGPAEFGDIVKSLRAKGF